MLKSREALKKFYDDLNDKYEGYVQMSDSRIEPKHLFKTTQTLPKWDELHNDINYIVEMALFNPSTKQSILIRQQNSEWLVIDKKLEGDEPTESFFTLTEDTPKMKIAQIWEKEENEFCLGLDVLEPKYLLFAGFEKEKK
ncbi:MAG: TIGR04423 family type III CRISPR-associated protein [Epsilonproteobacteria bacterium]|nr:TIGR04423 family type III CRISPR-associated protein [Campylobacterota bacterium]